MSPHLKVISSFLTIFFLLASCGPSVKETITSEKTARHIKVAGTNVYIIPPDGFGENATGRELVDFTTASRITISQFEDPFKLSQYTPAAHANTQCHRVAVNGYHGIYKSIRENETFLRKVLVFGNDKVTVVVSASILSADSAFINKVTASIRSVVLVDEKLPDPTDDAAFKIDAGKKLKFARYFNGMLVYTEAGDMLSKSSIDFIVSPRHGTIGDPDERKTTAEDYVSHEIYYNAVQIKESVAVTIDNMPGHAVTAEGVHENGNMRDLIYMVMLSGKDGSYVMLGTADADFKANLAMFKEIAKTFRLKTQ